MKCHKWDEAAVGTESVEGVGIVKTADEAGDREHMSEMSVCGQSQRSSGRSGGRR